MYPRVPGGLVVEELGESPSAATEDPFAGTGQRVSASLVALNAGGDRTPLFFVHGGFGQVFHYIRLAPLLGSRQGSYGFEAVGLWDEREPLASVEEMAATYIDEMRSVQRRGPYTVLGFSLGGAIAWKMAQLLTAEGESVAIALLDAPRPRAPTEEEIAVWRKERAGRPRREKIAAAILGPFRTMRFHFQVAGPMPMRRRGAYFRQWLRSRAAMWSTRLHLGEQSFLVRWSLQAGRAAPPGHIMVRQALWRAFSAHKATQFGGPVTLFRATIDAPGVTSTRTLGWDEIAAGGLEIVEVPGHHGYMFTEPYVRTLAREINAWRNRVQPDVDSRSETAEDRISGIRTGSATT